MSAIRRAGRRALSAVVLETNAFVSRLARCNESHLCEHDSLGSSFVPRIDSPTRPIPNGLPIFPTRIIASSRRWPTLPERS